MVEINDVRKTYMVKRLGRSAIVRAVSGVSLSIENGRCLGLVGESGCGKSTLGRMVSGLEKPNAGSVLFDGKDLYKEKKDSKKALCKEIQVVFQDSISSVDPRMNAKEIISEPLQNFGRMKSKQLEARVSELLKMVCIPDEDMFKYPFQFSGGQLQRICLARALALNPSLIVLDEPLSSLDVSVQAQILNLLSDVKKATNVSYLMISHDLEAVYYLSDSICVMYSGLIMESIEDIKDFNHLRHPYSLRLLDLREKRMDSGSEIEEAADTIQQTAGCPYYFRCSRRSEKCLSDLPELISVDKGHMLRCHNC